MDWFWEEQDFSEVAYKYASKTRGFQLEDLDLMMTKSAEIFQLRQEATKYFKVSFMDIEVFYIWKWWSDQFEESWVVLDSEENNIRVFEDFFNTFKYLMGEGVSNE